MDLRVHVLDPAQRYLDTIDKRVRGRIYADIQALRQGNFAEVRTKQLKGDIRELIRSRHRVTYFKFGFALYFVRGFAKKSQRTPKQEIEYAERLLQLMQNAHEKEN